jgi:hypothetical protein
MGLQGKTLERIEVLRTILAAQHPMTVRQVYYQMVVRGEENSQQSYGRVERWLLRGREEGLIDDEWIDDHLRPHQGGYTGNSESAEEFLDRFWDETVASAHGNYYLNPWEGQENYVEVWVEKDAMAGTLERLVGELEFNDVSVNACRGFASRTFLVDAAERFKAEHAEGRETVILYFGDFDPSGESMSSSDIGEGDLQNRLWDLTDFELNIEVRKVALNAQQFEDWFLTPGPNQLPHSPTPIKDDEKDSRSKGFRKKYGDYGAELDAVPIDRLRDILTEQMSRLIDSEAFAKVRERQDEDREEIKAELSKLSRQVAKTDEADNKTDDHDGSEADDEVSRQDAKDDAEDAEDAARATEKSAWDAYRAAADDPNVSPDEVKRLRDIWLDSI